MSKVIFVIREPHTIVQYNIDSCRQFERHSNDQQVSKKVEEPHIDDLDGEAGIDGNAEVGY